MMQNIFTNIKCSQIILYNANENWYIILYDLFSRLCYIATCGPFCKDATQIITTMAGEHCCVFRLFQSYLDNHLAQHVQVYLVLFTRVLMFIDLDR